MRHLNALLDAAESAAEPLQPHLAIERARRYLALGRGRAGASAGAAGCACALRPDPRDGRAEATSPRARRLRGDGRSGSRSAARATAVASIASDLPRVRAERSRAGHQLGGTRIDRSPRPLSIRSSEPDTCRQSSRAKRRSPESERAQLQELRMAVLARRHRQCASSSPVEASTATAVCVRLCGSIPITITPGPLP